ncbi:MAG: glycoside hydrolase family 97 protein [Ignavibacteriaceae bacterium]|nr:glycoside hydrolase family 97 protein [Ignavibacteriaceae bacterium]
MLLLVLLFVFFISELVSPVTIHSPSGKISLTFTLSSSGAPQYALRFKGRDVILQSRLGLTAADGLNFSEGFMIEKTDSLVFDETWEPVLGEVKQIRNHYKELKVTLSKSEDKKRIMILIFRIYDDGAGFRYEFPAQEHLKYFIVKHEFTEFRLTGDHNTFWIPGDYDTNEYEYSETRISKINALRGQNSSEISTRSIIGDNGVQTPLMMKSDEGLYINLFEAALVNYPAMHLTADREKYILTAHLTPDAVGNKAYLQTHARTPWRTILVSDKAEDILASKMILNLNEPSEIEETGWIKPVKYVGIWWEMHVGTSSWNYSDVNNVKIGETDWNSLKPNGRHGATTERTKVYIDFAAKHGFDAVLVEGWNVGWEDWFGSWKENVFDFVTPYPDFDVEEVHRYAASKGVKMIMHHETSGSVTNYERRMDEAFSFMKQHNYDAVKSGYVGRIIPRGEFHDGQWMVNHYIHAAKKAAEYKIMINAHESVRPTGLHRTYPNWLANEAARGNEFNAWSAGNPPSHETILPFTRLMGGPMDYTPGIFETKMSFYYPDKKEQVHTTLAKQLALYVTMYSPLQMAADYPENYERYPDAFQFIKDVPVDWDDTKILSAEPGDYIAIARMEKGSETWYLGAITDENPRTMKLPLDFLNTGVVYTAVMYADGKDAHWETNPKSYMISKKNVKAGDTLELVLAPGGGAAVQFLPEK